MAISLRNRDGGMQDRSSDEVGTRRPQCLHGHVGGRLAPLALDIAQFKIDATLLSLTVGGLTQKQIDEFEFVPSVLLARVRAAIRAVLLWWR